MNSLARRVYYNNYCLYFSWSPFIVSLVLLLIEDHLNEYPYRLVLWYQRDCLPLYLFRFIFNSANVTKYSIACRPLFRSYKPADEELQKASLPVAQPEAVDEQVAQELSTAAQAPALEEIVSKVFICLQFFQVKFSFTTLH